MIHLDADSKIEIKPLSWSQLQKKLDERKNELMVWNVEEYLMTCNKPQIALSKNEKIPLNEGLKIKIPK